MYGVPCPGDVAAQAPLRRFAQSCKGLQSKHIWMRSCQTTVLTVHFSCRCLLDYPHATLLVESHIDTAIGSSLAHRLGQLRAQANQSPTCRCRSGDPSKWPSASPIHQAAFELVCSAFLLYHSALQLSHRYLHNWVPSEPAKCLPCQKEWGRCRNTEEHWGAAQCRPCRRITD